MAIQFQDPLGDVPLRNAKADLKSSEPPRRNVTPRGALIDQARKAAEIEVKQMADAMGVSDSFLLRGFKDQEHISWQRLQRVSAQWPRFHREFLIAQAEDVDGIEVVTEIRVRRSA